MGRQAMCNSSAAPAAADCCMLLGAFVAPGAYLPLVLAGLAGTAVGSRPHHGALAALAALLEGVRVLPVLCLRLPLAGMLPGRGASCPAVCQHCGS